MTAIVWNTNLPFHSIREAMFPKSRIYFCELYPPLAISGICEHFKYNGNIPIPLLIELIFDAMTYSGNWHFPISEQRELKLNANA